LGAGTAKPDSRQARFESGQLSLRMRNWLLAVFVGAAFLLTGCATYAPKNVDRLVLTRELEDRILALNPERVTETDIREVLAHAPAPRIIAIHGGVLPFQFAMKSFSHFIVGMGYPEDCVRDPRSGSYSFSCYQSSAKLAGMVAWYYENEGMRPMMLGHSLGGMQVVKVLHEFTDDPTEEQCVWDPFEGKRENRYHITDPLTGKLRPVASLQVSYASTLGAGGLARTLPNQWSINAKLRQIPDSVDEFTGFYIGGDIFGGDYLGFGPANLFHSTGTARVRNVRLPTGSSHSFVPVTKKLLKSKPVTDWINNYTPANEAQMNEHQRQHEANILWAAEVWFSIKKHWVQELQRLIRARRDRRP
jgi:hypothetical protein